MKPTLTYPPPWQDKATLAAHLSVSTDTIETWAATGIIPAGRQRGGIKLWSWSEVQAARSGKVYFLRCGDFVKIGFTKLPKARFSSLRTASPYESEILAVIIGNKATERALHERFATHHHRLEWFRAAPELLDYISSLECR